MQYVAVYLRVGIHNGRRTDEILVFFSSRRRHTRYWRDWSSDVCSSDLSGSDAPAVGASQKVDGTGKTLKVWLMVDAQSGWKAVVDDAITRFKTETNADVQVEYQQWNNHLTKLDATLAGQDVPDVVELGNTEMPKYVFEGAFAEVNKGTFENSSTWLTGLSGPCELDGKTYCVPYYAGAR